MEQQFSPLEKKIAHFLAGFPALKQFIKRLYQGLNYIIYRKPYVHKSKHPVRSINYKNFETFFGYYDKSPLNESGTLLLFHASRLNTQKKPDSTIPLHIILSDFRSSSILKEFRTSAYNWQQGSRTQWINDTSFIFNDFNPEKKTFYSRIIDTRDLSIERKIDYPVYDVKGDKALTLRFERLALLRPDYGYNVDSIVRGFELRDLKNDGIFLVNLTNNESTLLLSLEEIIQHGKVPRSGSVQHKVNHLMYSPNGNKFIFLHRYFLDGKRFDRLFLYHFADGILKLLADDEMVSHYIWYGNHSIVCYMRNFEKGDHFYLIDVEHNTQSIFGYAHLLPFGDGHPNILNKKMLFDTYPDKSRMKNLYIYNDTKEELSQIGRFYESLKYHGETRCDLHPRWSSDGNVVFIDSVHEGKRQLYMLDMNTSE